MGGGGGEVKQQEEVYISYLLGKLNNG